MNRRLAAAILVACLSFTVIPEASASTQSPPVRSSNLTKDLLQTSLTNKNLSSWDALDSSQKAAVTTAANYLADHPGLQPGDAGAAKIGLVSSVISGTTAPVAIASVDAVSLTASSVTASATTYEVTSYYENQWTIFGVTFNKTRITYRYVTGSNKVLSDHACTATVTDNVPLRTYSVTVNHYVSSGTGTCIATWLVKKADGWAGTVSSDQGMTVNGAGITKTWGP